MSSPHKDKDDPGQRFDSSNKDFSKFRRRRESEQHEARVGKRAGGPLSRGKKYLIPGFINGRRELRQGPIKPLFNVWERPFVESYQHHQPEYQQHEQQQGEHQQHTQEKPEQELLQRLSAIQNEPCFIRTKPWPKRRREVEGEFGNHLSSKKVSEGRFGQSTFRKSEPRHFARLPERVFRDDNGDLQEGLNRKRRLSSPRRSGNQGRNEVTMDLRIDTQTHPNRNVRVLLKDEVANDLRSKFLLFTRHEVIRANEKTNSVLNEVHKTSVPILRIHPGQKVDILNCPFANCNLVFAENEIGVRGHIDPQNLSVENIPFVCVLCPEKTKFVSYTSFQKHTIEFHLLSKFQHMLPNKAPFICPIPSCRSRAANVWDLAFHFAGSKHAIFQRFLLEAQRDLIINILNTKEPMLQSKLENSDLPPNADLNLFYLAAEEDKETLERELRDAKMKIEGLRKELSLTQEDLKSQKTNLSEIAKAKSDKEKEARDFKLKYNIFQDKFETLKAANDGAKMTKVDQIKLNQELEVLRKENQEKREAEAAQVSYMRCQMEKQEVSGKQIFDLRVQINEKNSKLNILESDLSKKDIQLKIKEEEATNLKMMIQQKDKQTRSEIKARVDKEKLVVDRLMSEKNEKEQALADSEEKVKTLQGELEIYEGNLKVKEQKLKLLINEMSKKEKEIKVLTNAKTSWETETSDLKRQVESKDKSIGELSAEIHNLLTQKTLMPSEIYEFKIKTELKSLELNQMSHKKQTLEAQTDSKDLEVKKQSQTLETTKTELESKITNLNNELKRKSLDLSQAREKIALLEGQIFSKETEIQEMSRTIAQKDSIHSEEKESLKRVVEDAQRNANTFKENFNDSILRIQKLRTKLLAGSQLASQHAKLTREKLTLEKKLSEKVKAIQEYSEANKKLTEELTAIKELL